MKNALSITLVRQTFSRFGGAEKILSRITGEFRNRGITVNLIARQWENADGLNVWQCNPFYIGRLWRDFSFTRASCRLIQQQRAGLVQSHERIPCCDVYRAGDGVHRVWLAQRRRVLNPFRRLLQALNPYHTYTCYREKKLFLSPRLKAVICNSRMVKNQIMRIFGLPEQMLHVIYSGVDHAAFHPDLKAQRTAVLRELGVDAAKTIYLFVGSGYERKGLAQLLKALAALPAHAHAIVIGKDKKIKYFMRLAARLNVTARVSFLGPRPDVRPYYGAADCFVLPTLYDPFPNVALEAMAAGLPLITSTASGAAELIQNGVNGFSCDALDGASLLDAMRHCLDRQQCTKLGHAARDAVLPLSLEKMSGQLIALYEGLLHAR